MSSIIRGPPPWTHVRSRASTRRAMTPVPWCYSCWHVTRDCLPPVVRYRKAWMPWRAEVWMPRCPWPGLEGCGRCRWGVPGWSRGGRWSRQWLVTRPVICVRGSVSLEGEKGAPSGSTELSGGVRVGLLRCPSCPGGVEWESVDSDGQGCQGSAEGRSAAPSRGEWRPRWWACGEGRDEGGLT